MATDLEGVDELRPDSGYGELSPTLRLDPEHLVPDRPLTEDEAEAVDEQLMQMEEYEGLMEMCRDLKGMISESGAEMIAILELLRDEQIPEENLPEAFELLRATNEVFQGALNSIKDINTDLLESGIPVGDCSIEQESAPAVNPSQ